ncbi:MAG: hypothetical protein DRO04_00965 [Candidatus Iainarchaeum archaeon]|mgnify:CR=1 FL=1|uniref:Uncharacterized protein n=1 Tax=Candidatus Iainarchaeum sp. TaxID=3101447 RepID=A0A497JHZ8_9ARCH|nr:MAG: hypothetical protein DRO04_00965 [Candidatus Diapherotrites archaeon]
MQEKKTPPQLKEKIVVKEVDASEIDVIKKASDYAKILKDVVEKQKLYVVIQGRKYVRCEGWQVLGALLKCTPRIVRVTEIPNGFEAEAEIVNVEGKILSRAVARCTRNERNWANRDDYALMSMAQTRAVAKAFRLGFSWILGLAGYEPTPAEEVSGE